MAARFECHVKGRSLGGPASFGQGLDFGVRAAEAVVVPHANELALADDYGADHRVRLDAATTTDGLGQGSIHPEQVVGRHGGYPRRGPLA
jgi:hypothetical protein